MSHSDVIYSEVLERLQVAFRPYLQESTPLFESRQTISDYVSWTASRIHSEEQNVTLDLAITGVRRRYLEALRSNVTARRQYEESLAKSNGPVQESVLHNSAPEQTPAALLSSHLGVAKQQKLNSQLDILQRHLLQLEVLSEKLGTFDTYDVSSPGSQLARNDLSDLHDLTEAQRWADNLQRKLEIAVLQAKYRAQQEHNLLKQTRKLPVEPSAQDKFRATCIVRDELTRWIEENLARCVNNSPTFDHNNAELHLNSNKVGEQYQRYVAVRERLLMATRSLIDLLPDAPLRDHSQAQTTGIPRPMVLLPTIEKQLQTAVQQKKSLIEYQQHLKEQLATEREDALGDIYRLRDESQLLEAYPLLVKSKRFQHAAAVFGDKTAIEGDNMLEQVEAWSFAANAARNAAETTITSSRESATTALKKVDDEVQKFELFDRVFHGSH